MDSGKTEKSSETGVSLINGQKGSDISADVIQTVTAQKRTEKILLIGRAGGFFKALIRKLQKQKHTIFQLTDSSDMSNKDKDVFERYRFDMTSDSIREVIDSVKPDITIFAGAYDTAYDLTKNKDAMSFISSLMNVLISCIASGNREFIYVSSSEVFDGDYSNNISENTPINPVKMRAFVLSQAEDLCTRHGESSLMNVTIVRFDHLYGIPTDRADATDFCSSACLKLLLDNKISYNGHRTFSGVYMSDAIEGLYRIAVAPKRERSVYHISSGMETDEKKFADLLLGLHDNQNAVVEDITIGSPNRMMLDCTAAGEEFGYYPRCGYESSVTEVYNYIKKNLNNYMTDDEKNKHSFLSRFKDKTQHAIHTIWGILENLIVFVLVFIANNALANNEYFERFDFYLLYTLAFAVIYGRQMAVFSAFLSMVGYFITQAGLSSGFAVLIDLKTYIWVAQLFIVAITVGHIRERIGLITSDKDEEIEYLQKQLNEVEEINDSNKRIKHILEYRLVNYTESLGMLYEMISQIECMEPGQLLFRTTKTLSQIMDAEHVALYRVADYYGRLHAATTKEARKLGKSIRYRDFGLMSKAFAEGRVFINHMLDPMLPSMAVAVYEPGSEKSGDFNIEVIILVWNLTIDQMTLRQANLLTVVSHIVADAAYRAELYLQALVDGNYIKDTRILRSNAFSSILKTQEEANENGVTDFTLMYPIDNGIPQSTVSKILSRRIRNTDYIGLDEDNRLCVLLTNTDLGESEIVMNRISASGLEMTYDREKANLFWVEE